MATETYDLGGGKLFFAENVDGTLGDYFYFGRTDDDLKITIDIETLEHPNTEGKSEEIDFEIETKKQISFGITTDDMSQLMVARFFRGTVDTVAQTGATLTAQSLGAVKIGGTYETGFVGFDDLSIDTFAEGTDYSVDLGAGTVTVLAGGSIADDATIAVSGTYQTVSTDNVQVGTETSLEGSFKFVSDQTTGIRRRATMHKVSVLPSGEFALKGTKDWKKCSFDVKVLKDESIVTTGESQYMLIEELPF